MSTANNDAALRRAFLIRMLRVLRRDPALHATQVWLPMTAMATDDVADYRRMWLNGVAWPRALGQRPVSVHDLFYGIGPEWRPRREDVVEAFNVVGQINEEFERAIAQLQRIAFSPGGPYSIGIDPARGDDQTVFLHMFIPGSEKMPPGYGEIRGAEDRRTGKSDSAAATAGQDGAAPASRDPGREPFRKDYQQPVGDQLQLHDDLKTKASELLVVIETAQRFFNPDHVTNRCYNTATERLEEAVMWAVKGVLNPRNTEKAKKQLAEKGASAAT